VTASHAARPVRPRPVISGPAAAPVLVLSNSLGCDHTMWAPQLDALSARFRVVRYDMRGHGSTESPPGPYTIADLGGDLVALLDELGIGRANLAGLSLGGMVSMWVAAHAPGRVDRLMPLATSARLGPPAIWATRAKTVLAQGMDAVCDTVLSRWFTPAFAAARPRLVKDMRAMFVASNPVGYAGCCGAIERMDLLPDLGRIRAPTLVIVGAQDPATPRAHSEAIVAGIPGASLLVVEDAAHLVNVEQPEAVSAALMTHLSLEAPEEPR
jgi:3-oxoadipate enol-lactonase